MNSIVGFVKQDDKQFLFEVLLHVAKSPDNLKMERVEYYEKYAAIPETPHIEMEIMTLPPEAEGVKLHIHPVGERRFICWTNRVEDREKAEFVFKLWCLGCVYTILTDIPFEKYLFKDGIKGNSEAFEKALAEEFHISFVE